MEYPDFNKYWLGLNESWQDGTNSQYPTDPYEYKRNGSDDGGWNYYTRQKGSDSGWIPVTDQTAIDSIKQMVTFTGGDATDATGTVGQAKVLPDMTVTAPGATTTDGTVPADLTGTGTLASTDVTAQVDPLLIPLTGADALAKIKAIDRPDWKTKLLSTLPYAKVDGNQNSYFDAMGKIMYNEFNDPNSEYFGEPFLDKFTFTKTGFPNTGSLEYTDEDFDPANKPDYIINNPLYSPAASVKPEDIAKAQEVAKEEAALPGATSKQARIAQLRKEIHDARKKSRGEARMARKDARLDKRIQRLEDKQKSMGISNESRVYSFNEFVRSRRS